MKPKQVRLRIQQGRLSGFLQNLFMLSSSVNFNLSAYSKPKVEWLQKLCFIFLSTAQSN